MPRRLQPHFGQLPIERGLKNGDVVRRRAVARSRAYEAEATVLVDVPIGLLSVAESRFAADHGAGTRELIDGDRDAARRGWSCV